MIAIEQDRSTVALSRCALYGVAAAAFRHPDTPLFRSAGSTDELDALVDAAAFGGGSETERIVEAAHALHARAQSTDHATLLAWFVALFGHTSRGTAPPYETEYGTGGPFSQPQEMSDISGFYNAYGLEIDPDRHERFDHICCELEFMCFLCAKLANAIDYGDDEAAAEIVRTQRIFLRDHLARFGRTFFSRVIKEAADTWHGEAARFAMAFLDAECRRLDVPVERAYLPLRPEGNFDVPLECGNCAGECGADRTEED